MTLLYRVGDEFVIETSPATWEIIQRLIEGCDWTTTLHTQIELSNFANAIRAHLQHIAPASVKADDNSDLV